MRDATELLFDLIKLKRISVDLQTLADSLDSNRLTYTFEKSRGETADKMLELVDKYNELGAALGQLVREVKASTDMTREGVKRTDRHLSSCWAAVDAVVRRDD